MRRKRTYLLVGTLAALVVGAGVFLLVLGSDEPPPEVDDLVHYRSELAEADNGFVLLKLEPGVVLWPDDAVNQEEEDGEGEGGHDGPATSDLSAGDDAVDGLSDSFDAEVAASVVARNRAVLERLEVALDLRFQLPHPDLSEAWPWILELQKLAGVLGTRSRLALERGDAEEALRDVLRLFRLGERVEGSQGGMIAYLLGIGFQEVALEHVSLLLSLDRLSSDVLLALGRRLDGMNPTPRALADAYRAEFVTFRDVVDALAEGRYEDVSEVPLENWNFFGRLLFLPNKTKRLWAEHTRTLIQDIERLPRERQVIDPEEEFGLRGVTAYSNGIGKILIGLFAGGLEHSLQARDRFLAALGAARTLVALRACQLKTGALPGRLEELVPDYLQEVPRDPFDGNPLRYAPEDKIIYSVGTDLEDQGGSDEEDRRQDSEEPTFEIPF